MKLIQNLLQFNIARRDRKSEELCILERMMHLCQNDHKIFEITNTNSSYAPVIISKWYLPDMTRHIFWTQRFRLHKLVLSENKMELARDSNETREDLNKYWVLYMWRPFRKSYIGYIYWRESVEKCASPLGLK